MKQSLDKGEPIVMRTAKSVASGLAPPMAGKNPQFFFNSFLLL